MAYFSDISKDTTKNTNQEYIRTFLDDVDNAEGRKFFGINPGGAIIEICGASGSGKTLLCFQLCVSMSIPRAINGPEGEIIYIETDRKFFSHRLLDVYKGTCTMLGNKKWSFSKMFHYYSARTAEALMEVVFHLHTFMRTRFTKVRLIVIDSLSTIFRDLMSDFGRMVRMQNKLMSALAMLVQKYNILVVITSQITKKSLASESYCHRVDRRLILQRTRGNNGIGLIDKFPCAHTRTFTYVNTKDGIRSSSL